MWGRSPAVRVTHAARALMRTPGTTAAAILALSLGIGANAVVFSIVNATLLAPLPYADPPSVVIAMERSPQSDTLPLSYPDFLDWRRANRAFVDLAAQNRETFNLTGSGEPEQVFGSNVSASLFDVLGVRPMLGRAFTPDDDRPGVAPVVVVTHRSWAERFHRDPNIVGRVIVLDGIPRTIVGVLPRGFRFPIGDERGEIFSPLGLIAADLGSRATHAVAAIGRLKRGATLEAARADLDRVASILAAAHPSTNRNIRAQADLYAERATRPSRPLVLALWGAVAMVLLVACASAAAVLTARGAARTREFAIRRSLGATPMQLLAQLLAESALLASASAVLGLALAWAGLPTASAMLPSDVPKLGDISLDTRVLLFTVGAAVFTAILTGLVPAWQAGRTPLYGAASVRTGPAPPARARAALVVGELAISQALLLAAGLLIATLAGLLKTDVGFRPDHVVTALYYLPDSVYVTRQRLIGFHRTLIERVSALPDVAAAGLITPPPFGFGGSSSDVTIEGREAPIRAESFRVSPGALPALGVPLVAGRLFDDRDGPDGPPVVLVDERFASAWFGGAAAAVGKRVRIDGSPRPAAIVGVVGHVVARTLDAPAQVQIHTPLFATALHFTSIVARTKTADPMAVLPGIKQVVRSRDPDLPLFNAAPMAQLIAETAGRARVGAIVFAAFAAAAWMLAAIGLAGVVSNSVTSRTRELGIRLALGARPRALVAEIVVGGVRLAAMGLVLGLAAGLAAARSLSALLVGVRPSDPFIVTAAVLALVATGAAASYVPARRASRVDPAAALRTSD